MAQSAIIEAARVIIRSVNTIIDHLQKYPQTVTLGALIEEQRNLEQTIDEVLSGKRPLEDIQPAMRSLSAAERRSLAELNRLQGTNP